VQSLLQEALGPNVHEHYVELHLRTYRLFVLQTELNLIQMFGVAGKAAAAITLSNPNLQRERCAVSLRADVEEVSPFVLRNGRAKGVSWRKLRVRTGILNGVHLNSKRD